MNARTDRERVRPSSVGRQRQRRGEIRSELGPVASADAPERGQSVIRQRTASYHLATTQLGAFRHLTTTLTEVLEVDEEFQRSSALPSVEFELAVVLVDRVRRPSHRLGCRFKASRL